MKAVPESVLADSGAPVWVLNVTGLHRTRQRIANCFFFNGGMGRASRRRWIDTMAFPGNTGNTPIELMELWAPILVERKEIRTDSGGPGSSAAAAGRPP